MAGLVMLHFLMGNSRSMEVVKAAELISDGVDITVAAEMTEAATVFSAGAESETMSETVTAKESIEMAEAEVEQPFSMADFTISVKEDIPAVRAGQCIGYEICLENTGTVDLENIIVRSNVDNGKMKGEWLENEGLRIEEQEETVSLGLLEAGTSRILVYMVSVPEERTESIDAEFWAKVKNPLLWAEEESTTENGENTGTLQTEILSRSAGICTEIEPLLVDFKVSKWADRSAALPGDTIVYQICIRNTGERTLHSVLTTEKFQTAGLKARFLEKEGVILNGEKTEALIAEILPGEAVGLYAEVVLPKEFEGSELLNEVTVVTRETGGREFAAQETISVLEPQIPEETPVQQTERPIQTSVQKKIPQTEDLSETELWAGAFGVTCLIIIGVYWIRKAKRKH